jgi:hypothetical protein
MLCCFRTRKFFSAASGLSSKKNSGCCSREYAVFLMLWIMLMRSNGKAGVDVWSCCGWSTDVCYCAKAGGAIVTMTCGGAIGLITQVWSAAVTTEVDQETFCIHVMLPIGTGRVCVVPGVGLGSHRVGFRTMCSPACRLRVSLLVL